MKIRTSIAAIVTAAVLPLAACGTTASETTTSASSSDSDASASTSADDDTDDDTDDTDTDDDGFDGGRDGGPGGGGPGDVDLDTVSTEDDLVAVVQAAYGDGGLDLHRGHQPVQDVLDDVLAISHDELHVRMEEQGQNLAAVATDLGIEPQTLVDALVESWSPAIDNAVAAGAITEDQAAAYRTALEEAFTFRVTWDGAAEMPTFTGA